MPARLPPDGKKKEGGKQFSLAWQKFAFLVSQKRRGGGRGSLAEKRNEKPPEKDPCSSRRIKLFCGKRCRPPALGRRKRNAALRGELKGKGAQVIGKGREHLPFRKGRSVQQKKRKCRGKNRDVLFGKKGESFTHAGSCLRAARAMRGRSLEGLCAVGGKGGGEFLLISVLRGEGGVLKKRLKHPGEKKLRLRIKREEVTHLSAEKKGGGLKPSYFIPADGGGGGVL